MESYPFMIRWEQGLSRAWSSFSVFFLLLPLDLPICQHDDGVG